MLDVGKMQITSPQAAQAEGIGMGEFLRELSASGHLPLVFTYGGRSVKPGYHVTEVKAGAFRALDCGANPEAWTELFVQLWDVIDGDRTHMTASKFTAIVGKVAEHVELDHAAKLTFEVSDGVAPMQLYQASSVTIEEGVIEVALTPRVASCKPRDRWLAEQSAAACCGPKEPSCCS